jgi:uncharacterized membrane protein HdeD (DUF308 family)
MRLHLFAAAVLRLLLAFLVAQSTILRLRLVHRHRHLILNQWVAQIGLLDQRLLLTSMSELVYLLTERHGLMEAQA